MNENAISWYVCMYAFQDKRNVDSEVLKDSLSELAKLKQPM